MTAKPNLPEGVTLLTPLQLNAIHFSGKHTPLTPEKLAQAAAMKSRKGQAQSPA